VTGTGAQSIAEALIEASQRGVDRLDGQLMLSALLRQPRTWLIAHGDAFLTADQTVRFAQWLHRRTAGEPLAYLLGEKEFYGLRLEVGPAVLVPRPETELLVDWALELLRTAWPAVTAPKVVDLGCGSGAIALAVKHACPRAEVTAVDASVSALDTARRNAELLALSIDARLGSWWGAVPTKRFHLALSNPPYIAPGDTHLAALRHEPQCALVAADDGLADLHAVIDGAPGRLEAGGWLLLEHGHTQAAAVGCRMQHAGFTEVQTRLDAAGHPRASGGTWCVEGDAARRVVGSIDRIA
jgi:release factor glutamine methyltransferase